MRGLRPVCGSAEAGTSPCICLEAGGEVQIAAGPCKVTRRQHLSLARPPACNALAEKPALGGGFGLSRCLPCEA